MSDQTQPRRRTPQLSPLPFHPIANIFPLMTGKDLDDLVEDIRRHGLHEPTTVYEDKVLEGRNRELACIEAGAERHYQQFQSDDPVAYVISANIRRRHLDAGQKGELIAKLLKMQPEKSDRQVAVTAKIAHTTVARTRKALERSGDVEQRSTRTDAAGRQQPAKRKKTAAAARSTKTRRPAEPVTPEQEPTPAEANSYTALVAAWLAASLDDRHRFLSFVGARFIETAADGLDIPAFLRRESTSTLRSRRRPMTTARDDKARRHPRNTGGERLEARVFINETLAEANERDSQEPAPHAR
jgi:hypothetical protein